jgi:hypothetical protein
VQMHAELVMWALGRFWKVVRVIVLPRTDVLSRCNFQVSVQVRVCHPHIRL